MKRQLNLNNYDYSEDTSHFTFKNCFFMNFCGFEKCSFYISNIPESNLDFHYCFAGCNNIESCFFKFETGVYTGEGYNVKEMNNSLFVECCNINNVGLIIYATNFIQCFNNCSYISNTSTNLQNSQPNKIFNEVKNVNNFYCGGYITGQKETTKIGKVRYIFDAFFSFPVILETSNSDLTSEGLENFDGVIFGSNIWWSENQPLSSEI